MKGTVWICMAFLSAVTSMCRAEPIAPRSERARTANILVTMKQGTHKVLAVTENSSFRFATTAERAAALRSALVQNAASSQTALLKELKKPGRSHHVEDDKISSFWITNQIFIRNATSDLRRYIEGHPDVARVDIDTYTHTYAGKMSQTFTSSFPPAHARARAPPIEPGYNLAAIGVPDVWSKGVNGSGVVVAIIDTGVEATHEALRDSYMNDEFSWHDAVNGRRTPYDDHGHGTASMGLLVGANNIGVAPGANWITCKGYDKDGLTSHDRILDCATFLFCPDPPDCSHAFNGVFSVGWNDRDTASDYLDQVMEDLARHTDKVAVSSAGDYGQGGACLSIGLPAHYSTMLSVGATDANDALWTGSSKGPTLNGTLKPDLVAPGVNVVSACAREGPDDDTTKYCTQTSGTGIAAPIVAGVVALLFSANPELNATTAKEIIKRTAERRLKFTETTCGGIVDSTFPNNHFGYGRVDALAAYECAIDPLHSCLNNGDEPGGDGGGGGGNGNVLWIALGLVGGGLVVILGSIAVIFVRQRRIAKGKRADSAVTVYSSVDSILDQFRNGVWPQMDALRDLAAQNVLDGSVDGGEIANYIALTKPYDFEQYEIALDKLQIDKGRELGSGEFGVVFAGVLWTTKANDRGVSPCLAVAVKKLRVGVAANEPATAVADFLKELKIMSFVGAHPNIVKLIGACTRVSSAAEMCMVLELCSNGNLEKYLRSHRSVFIATDDLAAASTPMTTPTPTAHPNYVAMSYSSNPVLTPLSPITTHDLVRWTLDIATGMNFLALKKVVHGDLATRNVLLDENLVAKISDFGLASRLYEYKYETTKQSEERPLPWRCMAPEVLASMKFSTFSDIWSFGITAWEIFSLAEVPYPGLVWGQPFLRSLTAGYRNVKPKYATDELFAIISRCWELEPSRRPRMEDLKQMIADLRLA